MNMRNLILHFQQQNGVVLLDDLHHIADDFALARRILERLNRYFYQTYDGNGVGILDEREYEYLPEFHKYWEAHHAEIINAKNRLAMTFLLDGRFSSNWESKRRLLRAEVHRSRKDML